MTRNSNALTAWALALATMSSATAGAQSGGASNTPNAPAAPSGAPAPGPMRMPPITLGPDEVRAVSDAPTGFNAKREGIPHGKLEMIEYDSRSVGARRKMLVYT